MLCVNKLPCLLHGFKLLLLAAALLGGSGVRVESLDFSFKSFPNRDKLILTKQANVFLDALQVTGDVRGRPISYQSGRIWFNQPFKLWSRQRGVTASFNSTFVLNITPQSDPAGEGLAFILTAEAGEKAIPENSHGQWLGIVNASTNGTQASNIVAVEFDTKKSYSEDLDDNHVGLDVNSIFSIKEASSNVKLSSATNVTATVSYDGKSKTLRVFVANGRGENMANPVISETIELSKYLPENVYVGFSASTGNRTQLNCVRAWSFSSTEIKEDSSRKLLWVWIMIPVIVILLTLSLTCYFYWRKNSEEQEQIEDPMIEEEIRSSTTAPKKFKLRDLKSATGNFNPNNELGRGGFGIVYKGFLNNKEVAVKRFSKGSQQGKQDFVAEVTTISNLRHKNLVKLIGWCHESKELLLVYEFMPNGSLDKLIYINEKLPMEDPTLGWEIRHRIICGVARALDYLHNGCDKRVFHRDIKASNIMLDSDYNARLGDFGLARTAQLSEKTHHSTQEIAGTPGYMAPESFHIGRATAETDAYAFGVLVLEVVCGRKPGAQSDHNNYNNSIVDWVWALYRRERLIDAVDSRLHVEFEKEEAECMLMLGLACCHPNPYERPSMRTALQVLTGEAAPPSVPIEKPVFMWPAMAPSISDVLDRSFVVNQLTSVTVLAGR